MILAAKKGFTSGNNFLGSALGDMISKNINAQFAYTPQIGGLILNKERKSKKK
jgi:hypothetical protein